MSLFSWPRFCRVVRYFTRIRVKRATIPFPLVPCMEHRFTLFVAYATLAAHTQLQVLLAKYRCAPSIEIIQDAARYGVQSALGRLFPGLIKLPFQRDPLPDVVLALRYEHEEDPENLGVPVRRPSDSAVPVGASSTRWRVGGSSRQIERPSAIQPAALAAPRPAETDAPVKASRAFPFAPIAPPPSAGATVEPPAPGYASSANIPKLGAAIFPGERRK